MRALGPNGFKMLLVFMLVTPASYGLAQTTTQGALPAISAASSPGAMPPQAPVNATVTPTIAATAAMPLTGTQPSTVSTTPAESAVGGLPATPTNAAPAVPVTPATVGATIGAIINDNAASSSPAHFSFGDSDVSILFLPAQTQVMKQALTNFESRPVRATLVEKAKEPTLKLDVVAVEPQHVSEPTKYPVFYLSSIVYHGPNDWSLWLSGHKITSAKNATDVTVSGVSADQASFSWTPAYTEAMTLRKQHKTFASTDKVKNRLAAIQSGIYDEKSGKVTFHLKTNQSFVAGYFSTFEGYMESPTLEPALPPGTPVPVPVPLAGAAPNTPHPDNNLDEVIQQKTISDVIKAKGE